MELTQEEKVARQEKITNLIKEFNPPRFNFIGKPEEGVSFEFKYSGDTPILALEPGCTACTSLECDGETIKGILTLDSKEKYTAALGVQAAPINKSIQVWFDDGEDWYTIGDNFQRHPNPKKISIPLFLSGQVDLR